MIDEVKEGEETRGMFADTFETALAKFMKERIEKFARKRGQELAEQFRVELSQEIKDLAARASIEIFKLVSFQQSQEQLIITVKQVEAKQNE